MENINKSVGDILKGPVKKQIDKEQISGEIRQLISAGRDGMEQALTLFEKGYEFWGETESLLDIAAVNARWALKLMTLISRS